MSVATNALFPAPPASGQELVERHWAVTAIPVAERLALLQVADREAGEHEDPRLHDAAWTLATAYELAALVGRDAWRSLTPTPAADLERSALQLGADRAALLLRTVGLPMDDAPDTPLRRAVHVAALAAVAGPQALALTRHWLAAPLQAQRLERATHTLRQMPEGEPEAALWTIWRELLLRPAPQRLEALTDEIGALRERTASAPALQAQDLRRRFEAFVRDRLAEVAGLLVLGLRDRADVHALAHRITARCATARSAAAGDAGLDRLIAWLELGSLALLRDRRLAEAIR